MAKPAAEFVFCFRLWWSLFLVKLQAFAINGSEKTVTEFVISVFQTVLEFALFDGCFGKLIKLISDCCYDVKKTFDLVEIFMSRK